jgi:hypothetical protein
LCTRGRCILVGSFGMATSTIFSVSALQKYNILACLLLWRAIRRLHPRVSCFSFCVQLSALHAYSCLLLHAALAAIRINKESPHAVIRGFFAILCFHSLDSAPILPRAPPPGKHFTGVGFPMASRPPKLVVSPRYLEPFM